MSFVCALLVVAIHCTYKINGFHELPAVFAWSQAFVNYGVTRIAVPMFFVMFGFLLFRDFEPNPCWWKRKLKSRAKSLVLPYFTWVAISLLIIIPFNALRSHPEPAHYTSVIWWLRAWGVTAPPPSLYVLWFVRTLIIFMAVAPAIGWLVRRFGFALPMLFMGAGVAGCAPLGHWAHIAFGACIAIVGVPQRLKCRAGKKALWALGISWGVLMTSVVLERLCLYRIPPWENALLTHIMNIIGMTFVWFLYDHVDSWQCWRWVDGIAKSAFIVYTMHALVSLIVQYPMMKCGLPEFSPFLFCGISYALMAGVPICFWIYLKRHAPRWLLLALTGGR